MAAAILVFLTLLNQLNDQIAELTSGVYINC
jgi:hypothetical protein